MCFYAWVFAYAFQSSYIFFNVGNKALPEKSGVVAFFSPVIRRLFIIFLFQFYTHKLYGVHVAYKKCLYNIESLVQAI